MGNKKKFLAPSILDCDFSRLGEEIRAVETRGVDLFHIDVMDGHFVPNLTIGPSIVKAIRGLTPLPLNVHLMIDNPEKYIERFIEAGANYLSFHLEVNAPINRLISQIKNQGVKAGVALNPATPLTLLENILGDLDFVLIMSVEPGFGGQTFIKSSYQKIRNLKEMIDKRGLKVDIEVDGGLNLENIAEVSTAGANIFAVGSTIFKSPDYGKIINALKKKIESPYDE